MTSKSVIVFAAIAGLLAAAVLSSLGRRHNQPHWLLQARFDRALDTIRSSGNVSAEVYAPESCEGGVGSCVRFYAQDQTGASHLWGWEYEPRAGQLRECLSYPGISAPCGRWSSAVVSDVGQFDARPISLSGKRNSAVLLSVEEGSLLHKLTIESKRSRFDNSVITVAALPNIGQSVEANAPRLIFYNASQGAGAATFTLANFGPYVKYLNRAWDVSKCGATAETSLVADMPSGDSARVRVVPERPGRCTFTVSAAPGQKIATPATADVTVMGDLSWSNTSAQKSLSVQFASPISTPQSFSAYKLFGDGELVLRPLAQSCSKIVSLHAGPATPVEGGNLTVSRAVVFKPISAGVCKTLIHDQYTAAGDPPIEVSALVMGALSFSQKGRVTNKSLTFQGLTDGIKTVTLYKDYDSVPIRPILAVNGCSAVAAFDFERGSVLDAPSASLASTRVLVAPASFGWCTTKLGDQYSGDLGVSVHIHVAPSIVFESTLAPPKTLTLYDQHKPLEVANLKGDCNRIVAQIAPSEGRRSEGLDIRPVGSGMCESWIGVKGFGREHFMARVMGDLTLERTRPLRQATLRFSSPSSNPRTITFFKSWDAVPLVPTLVSNGCAAMVGFYLQPSHAPMNPSIDPVSTPVVVRPIKAGDCTTVFGDQYGAHDAEIRVHISVGEATHRISWKR